MASPDLPLKTAQVLDRMLAGRTLVGIGVSAVLSHVVVWMAAVVVTMTMGGDVIGQWLPGTAPAAFQALSIAPAYAGTIPLIVGGLVGLAFSRSGLGWPELLVLSAVVALPWLGEGAHFLFSGPRSYGMVFAPVVAWALGLFLVWTVHARVSR